MPHDNSNTRNTTSNELPPCSKALSCQAANKNRPAVNPDGAVTQLLQDKLKLIEARMVELGELRHQLQQRLGQRCPLNP